MEDHYDIIVVGAGVAGLSTALSCVEQLVEAGEEDVTLAVLERSTRDMRGGSSRWTGAYLRMADSGNVSENFVEDMMAFSEGYSDEAVVRRLAEEAPRALAWLAQQGVAFEHLPTIFLTAARPRLLPVGGGKAVVERLADKVESYGVEILYETAFQGLRFANGELTGVDVGTPQGPRTIGARAVVLAAGGFEGNPEMLARYFPHPVHRLRNISPGGEMNKGEGIEGALRAGAKPAGEFNSFHAEPIDPRSRMPEAVVMLFPYGILVNTLGERFVDEGEDTIDETYERISRTFLTQPGQTAYCICDQRVFEIPNYHHAIGTDQEPVTAATAGDLAAKLHLPPAALEATIASYNAASAHNAQAEFQPLRKDGNAAAGVTPGKSNWALPLTKPPYVAWPLRCSIVFTYGGIAADTESRVLDRDERPIPGLYAAGEITGLYYGKYPGATSFLRGIVYGRIAGRGAAEYVRTRV